MMDLSKNKNAKATLEMLAAAPDGAMAQAELFVKSDVNRSNFGSRVSRPLEAEGLIRIHNPSTHHIILSITEAGRAALKGNHKVAGPPKKPECWVMPETAVFSVPNTSDRVALATELVSVESQLASLSQRRGELLKELAEV